MDPNIVIPSIEKFGDLFKLPTNKDVIGVLRHLTENKCSHALAIAEVAKRVYAKWFHDSIYCLHIRTIRRKIETLWNIFREGKRRHSEGRATGKAIDNYKILITDANKLFDVYETDQNRQSALKEEWGVTMSEREFLYYEDMKSSRKMICDHGVNPVWYAGMMRRQRLMQRSAKEKESLTKQFQFKSLEEIENILSNSESASDSDIEPSQLPAPLAESQENEAPELKKRKVYQPAHTENDDYLPVQFRSVRTSERKVRDEIYKVIGDLIGAGLSIGESIKAVLFVANGLFDRKWKEFDSLGSVFDEMTMPHERNVRDKMALIEAQTLASFADEIHNQSKEGKMITHVIDSTTKKNVGSFATQGIHIGQNVPFPLPLINISGETTMDIALQVDFGFQVLAAVKKKTPEEIYKDVDAHMTDSTEHNKGFAGILAELYNLDSPAGQLFGGAHTTLGFSSAINKMVAIVESDMKLETITSHFMVEIDFDSKNGSFAGQALDMMLRLVAPEFMHKPWNYYKQFDQFLSDMGEPNVLFSYKDHRFGCLSRAAAVLLYNFDHLKTFLETNQQITNRLACLVRNLMELPYLKVVFCVMAIFGVHLIEPFYCRTISAEATHSSLKDFYKNLHNSMSQTLSETFFNLRLPSFAGVSDRLFKAVCKDYGTDVLESVRYHASEQIDDVVKLANFILPELRTVLARQRRDYGIDDAFPAQFPVEEQASNVDDTPVTNLAMERQCATVDYRLPKLKKLSAVSRSLILAKTKGVISEDTPNFRSFREEVESLREVNLKWSKHVQDKFASGTNEKQVVAQEIERKRRDILNELKSLGGPFTSDVEVANYLKNTEDDERVKQKRMKLEVKFARDSSITLPKSDKLFRIQITLPNKKRRDKTALEFSECLMAFLGRKSSTHVMEYNVFKNSLEKCSSFGT